jgi:DNA-binding NtrC family response regulator
MLKPEHLGLTHSCQADQPMLDFQNAMAMPQFTGENDGFPTLAEIERHHILAALDQCKNNRTHAAKRLDVSIRTLRNKLNEYKGVLPVFEESRMTA